MPTFAIVTSSVMDLTFTLLTADLAAAIEAWFDDPDTMRHLGGREWIHQALHLLQVMPGYQDGDIAALDRRCWVVEEADRRAALLDIEVYNDATASLAIVVAPDHRRHRVARRVLSPLWDLSELAKALKVFGCIDAGNVASRRCFAAAGFIVDNLPDQDGMLQATADRLLQGVLRDQRELHVTFKIDSPIYAIGARLHRPFPRMPSNAPPGSAGGFRVSLEELAHSRGPLQALSPISRQRCADRANQPMPAWASTSWCPGSRPAFRRQCRRAVPGSWRTRRCRAVHGGKTPPQVVDFVACDINAIDARAECTHTLREVDVLSDPSVYLGLLDILGFKEFVERNDHERIVKIYKDAFGAMAQHSLGGAMRLIESSGQQVLVPDLSKIRVQAAILSDSILVWTPDDSMKSFVDVVCSLRLLLNGSFFIGLPLRGAIVCGPLTVLQIPFQENPGSGIATYVGRAVTAAYRLEREQAWAGCIVSSEAIQRFEDQRIEYAKKYKDLASIDYLVEKQILAKHPVPLKNEKYREEYVLNWASVSENRPPEDVIPNAFEMWEKSVDSEDVRTKIKNTTEFFRTVRPPTQAK